MKKGSFVMAVFILKAVYRHAVFMICAAIVFAGSASSQPQPTGFDPIPAIIRLMNSQNLTLQWKGLSLLIAVRRAAEQYVLLNNELDTFIAKNPTSPHLPWIVNALGNNYLEKLNYPKAIENFEVLESRFGSHIVGSSNGTVRALEGLAETYRRSGDRSRALAVLRKLLAQQAASSDKARVEIQLGELYAAMGDLTNSVASWQRVIDRPFDQEDTVAVRQLREVAARSIAIATSSRSWYRTNLESLVNELSAAIDGKDIEKLLSLASPFDFAFGTLGMGANPIRNEQLMQIIESDLKSGTVYLPTPPTFMGHNESKVYVPTRGWKSEMLTSTVLLLLERSPFGWQWRGLVLYGFPSYHSLAVQPFPSKPRSADSGANGPNDSENTNVTFWTDESAPPTNGQPLPFELKAPWEAGKSMLSGRNDWNHAETGGRCTETLGWPGYYYGQGTHADNDYYAIDFNNWQTRMWQCGCLWRVLGKCIIPEICIDWFTRAGYEVRSVADGKVLSSIPSNGQVSVQHLNLAYHPDGYASVYAHMRPVFVEVGQYVVRGMPLGRVDDVGESSGDHLHFKLYQTSSGSSVMPSPIEGVERAENGNLACIESTNNGLYVDSDGDDIPDSIDNCPDEFNPLQQDKDDDNIGDSCDQDIDGDGVDNLHDNCPLIANPCQEDSDNDEVGDVCDNCRDVSNGSQSDADGNHVGDACDLGDSDGDGLADKDDPCPNNPNINCPKRVHTPGLIEAIEDWIRLTWIAEQIGARFGFGVPPTLWQQRLVLGKEGKLQITFADPPQGLMINVVDDNDLNVAGTWTSQGQDRVFSFDIFPQRLFYVIGEQQRAVVGRKYSLMFRIQPTSHNQLKRTLR